MDACVSQVEFVQLKQQEDGTRRLNAYCSRTLLNFKRKLAATYKYFLVVVWEVFLLRPSLELRRFIKCIEQEALKWLLISADASETLPRWRLLLPDVDLKVVLQACFKHQASVALSFRKKEGTDKISFNEELPVVVIKAIEEQEDLQTEYFD